MLRSEYERELNLIRSLRRQDVISPQEAYERHMSLITAYSHSQVAAPIVAPARHNGDAAAAQAGLSDKTGFNWRVLAVLVAMIGGAFGIPGAFLQELYGGGGIFLAFTGAPIIEEALKPTGVYILLLRWPQLVINRTYTAVLSAIGGLCFALIESLIYVTLYFPEGSNDFVLFRFTVPIVMHCTGSFLVGLGLSQGTIDWAAGRGAYAEADAQLLPCGRLPARQLQHPGYRPGPRRRLQLRLATRTWLPGSLAHRPRPRGCC